MEEKCDCTQNEDIKKQNFKDQCNCKEEKLNKEVDEAEKEDKEFEGIEENSNEDNKEKEKDEMISTIKNLKSENAKFQNELDELKDRLTRTVAEYDNYRKRTTKEKEALYVGACEDVLKEMLPVLDNLERAAEVDGNLEDIKKGIEMTIKQFQTSLEKLGVEEIPTKCQFDPNIHNAVMHMEDSEYGEKEIVEVFQKGYKKGDKVIRYSMVKVAN
ncbi:nucleotide exchange factor GrpE [Clostridium niameyense]|uniref:Protein GrpE n=1 Tax=Clostridium niameyense TaxID=1622073 RepID=A0A6M0R7M8_9CLOT|nr:nucleotide exchange factor GrpE [Clostridium niameyense]NEZ45700.1 nucleotide exchange factor GrpE [Clostridium niameyense]